MQLLCSFFLANIRKSMLSGFRSIYKIGYYMECKFHAQLSYLHFLISCPCSENNTHDFQKSVYHNSISLSSIFFKNMLQ